MTSSPLNANLKSRRRIAEPDGEIRSFGNKIALARFGAAGGQPHVYVTITISLAEFMFMKEGQWVAGVVGKGRFSLVNLLPKI
jgi:hypothetical protein